MRRMGGSRAPSARCGSCARSTEAGQQASVAEIGRPARRAQVRRASRLVATLVAAGFLERAGRHGARRPRSRARAARTARDEQPVAPRRRRNRRWTPWPGGGKDGHAVGGRRRRDADARPIGRHPRRRAAELLGRRSPTARHVRRQVLLAFGAARLARRCRSRPGRRTRSSTADVARRVELERARDRGWASAEGDFELGLHGVAAPIRTADGICRAVLCIFRSRVSDPGGRSPGAGRAVRERSGAHRALLDLQPAGVHDGRHMSADRPDILLIQADQLSAAGPRRLRQPRGRRPHTSTRSADEGVVFDRAYCNSPLCAPSRASMLAGALPSEIGTYDNAAEFPAAVPTFAHRLPHGGLPHRARRQDALRRARPAARLRGAADHGRVPGRLRDGPRLAAARRPAACPGTHDARSIGGATASTATLQRDYDDEGDVPHAAHADGHRARPAHGDERPFLLVSSFIAPHDPYEPPQEHWDRYADAEIDLPATHGEPAARDATAVACGRCASSTPTLRPTTRSGAPRRGYYGCVSYLDDQVGAVLGALDELGLSAGTPSSS